jgi:hypothetical protein
MAVTTFERAGGIDSKASEKGFARRLLDRYIDAQMQKAQRRVNAYLQTMDDKALARLGYSQADIRNIRASDGSVGLII